MKSSRWKILSLLAASPLMGFCIATGEEDPQSTRAPRVSVGPSDRESVKIVRARPVDVTTAPIPAVNETR
jgi:hypothetical protein